MLFLHKILIHDRICLSLIGLVSRMRCCLLCQSVRRRVRFRHHFQFELAAVTHHLGLSCALPLLWVVVLLLNMKWLLLGLRRSVWDRSFVSFSSFVLEWEVLRYQRDVAHWLTYGLLLHHLWLSNLALFPRGYHASFVSSMCWWVSVTWLSGLGYGSLRRSLNLIIEKLFWKLFLLNLSVIDTLQRLRWTTGDRIAFLPLKWSIIAYSSRLRNWVDFPFGYHASFHLNRLGCLVMVVACPELTLCLLRDALNRPIWNLLFGRHMHCSTLRQVCLIKRCQLTWSLLTPSGRHKHRINVIKVHLL